MSDGQVPGLPGVGPVVRLCAFHCWFIPGQGIKILQTTQHSQRKEKKKTWKETKISSYQELLQINKLNRKMGKDVIGKSYREKLNTQQSIWIEMLQQ